MRKFRSILILIISASAILMYQNCSGVKLENYKVASYKASKIGMDFCTTQPDTIMSNLKFIFVQDRSGSNQIRYDLDTGDTLPGTDPTGIRRFPPIIDFLENSVNFDPDFTYYSWVNFNTFSEIKKFGINNFTKNRIEFVNYVNSIARPPYSDANNPQDMGDTNYRGALDNVKKIIQEDVAKAEQDFLTGVTDTKVATNYVIFFVSDGEPIDGTDPDGDTILDVQPLPDILKKIDEILAFQDIKRDYVDGIVLNSAYYYSDPISLTARSYLQAMANTGNGTYLEFSGGQEIDFSRFSVPTRVTRFALRELWVTNANTVWDGDYLAPDSDSDGISDFKERELRSNSKIYDSDGNGLGDGVELKLYGKPCLTDGCTAPGSGTSQCASFIDPANPSRMIDTDLDDLNDCEEVLLKSNRKDPDTNGDYIPDGLAFRSGLKFIQASNAEILDPDFDQLSDYFEVKYNSPNYLSNSKVPNLKLTRYFSRQTSSDADKDCYHFDVSDLVFQGPDDKMRVYIIENTKVLSERRVIRRAEIPASFGYLYLDESSFQKYQP